MYASMFSLIILCSAVTIINGQLLNRCQNSSANTCEICMSRDPNCVWITSEVIIIHYNIALYKYLNLTKNVTRYNQADQDAP